MDKLDNSIDDLGYGEQNNVDKVTDDNVVISNNTTSRFKYILYVTLFIIFAILVILVIRVLFTNEPPLLVLNEMLNNTLEIKAVSK